MTVLAEEVDPLALERQVCFALAVTNRAVLAVYRPLLEPLSVKQIAASLQLDSATLSPMLKRLEALGLITRTRSAFDERATDVQLTKAGVQLRRKALKIPPAVIERLGVGLDELEHLHEVLTRINAAALAAGALEGERS
jgi:DNA-binding MarR family transcriptional regulator